MGGAFFVDQTYDFRRCRMAAAKRPLLNALDMNVCILGGNVDEARLETVIGCSFGYIEQRGMPKSCLGRKTAAVLDVRIDELSQFAVCLRAEFIWYVTVGTVVELGKPVIDVEPVDMPQMLVSERVKD